MALNTNDLNYPSALEQSVNQQIQQYLKAPPMFGGANKMFSTLMSNPSLMLGPGGGWADPMQQQSVAGTNYLNTRGQIASQNQQEKGQLVGLDEQVGNNISSIANAQTMLEAQNVANGNGGGVFGSLFGG